LKTEDQNQVKKIEFDDEYAFLKAIYIFKIKEKTYNNNISWEQAFSLTKVCKKQGKKADEATFEEVNQLHKRNYFQSINVEDLAEEERRRALESLIFLSEKRDGSIKGRACTNGSKQSLWMEKEDRSSPTVLLDSIMLTCVIEAYESRGVATVNIPNNKT
jgi:hypothetical protein